MILRLSPTLRGVAFARDVATVGNGSCSGAGNGIRAFAATRPIVSCATPLRRLARRLGTWRIVRSTVEHPERPGLRRVDVNAREGQLRELTLTHRVGVAAVDTPSHPLLDSQRGSAVVVGFQPELLEQFVAACPALRESEPALHELQVFDGASQRVDLVDLILGCRMDPGYQVSAGPPGALRLCAWTACALHIPDGQLMLLDGVLAPHRRLVGGAPQTALPVPGALH